MHIRARVWAISLLSFLCMATVSEAAEGPYFSKQQICKAAVSAIMGRNPKIIKINRTKDGIVYLSYRRPDDGTRWAVKCKTEGTQVIWASDNPDSLGRWRTHPEDEKVYFSTPNGPSILHIQQRFSDGSTMVKSYKKSEL